MSDPPRGSHQLRTLQLRDLHAAAGARFVGFAGWEMPLQYTGAIKEHQTTREAAGLFDVSHLGRVTIEGDGATAQLRSVTTFDIAKVRPGRAQYTLYCNSAGGIEDDVLVYRLEPERWLVIHNAANADAGFARLRKIMPNRAQHVTESTAMLAIQGPLALPLLGRVVNKPLSELPRFGCLEVTWAGRSLVVARTGYTGEDGAECILEPSAAEDLWNSLVDAGATPVGIGARDTLRLEAALPLHGSDIDASTNPFEAGLRWAVSLEDGADFTGRTTLRELSERMPERALAHLRTEGRAVLRPGYSIEADKEPVGTFTSGTFSPTLGYGIGMAYLPLMFASSGTILASIVRGKPVPVEVVPRPFYRRPS
ncbi:MAG TPA: glycine cleavage system aminomethyltransferase GcvT [Dehalococcoidia bacterium]|nr:glycine cleavage system aminomethyltransferase GcvT [Dehalococcoidia bacterium]